MNKEQVKGAVKEVAGKAQAQVGKIRRVVGDAKKWVKNTTRKP